MPRVTVSRKEHFNAAHRLYNPDWSNQKNNKIFGKCNNPNWHGHNYDLIISVTGEINLDTGFVCNMQEVSGWVKNYIVDRFDHKNLNLDTHEFKHKIPTTENFALVIYQILREVIPKELELKIKLYETERNFVEYPV